MICTVMKQVQLTMIRGSDSRDDSDLLRFTSSMFSLLLSTFWNNNCQTRVHDLEADTVPVESRVPDVVQVHLYLQPSDGNTRKNTQGCLGHVLDHQSMVQNRGYVDCGV